MATQPVWVEGTQPVWVAGTQPLWVVGGGGDWFQNHFELGSLKVLKPQAIARVPFGMAFSEDCVIAKAARAKGA